MKKHHRTITKLLYKFNILASFMPASKLTYKARKNVMAQSNLKCILKKTF